MGISAGVNNDSVTITGYGPTDPKMRKPGYNIINLILLVYKRMMEPGIGSAMPGMILYPVY